MPSGGVQREQPGRQGQLAGQDQRKTQVLQRDVHARAHRLQKAASAANTMHAASAEAFSRMFGEKITKKPFPLIMAAKLDTASGIM